MHCKVADFGLAQHLYATATERLFTWQWLAPEVLDEKHVAYTEKIDVFSFGMP